MSEVEMCFDLRNVPECLSREKDPDIVVNMEDKDLFEIKDDNCLVEINKEESQIILEGKIISESFLYKGQNIFLAKAIRGEGSGVYVKTIADIVLRESYFAISENSLMVWYANEPPISED